MGKREALLLGHSRRGMDVLLDLMPEDFCTQTGRFVLSWPRGRVLLVTGFYVDGKGETDGPPGTRLLFHALKRLGFSPLIVTDPFCADYFAASDLPFVTYGPQAGAEELNELLIREDPVGLIATERCGRAADGRYINAHGHDVGPRMAPLDELFLRFDGPTVGIGDGGNEIGMGNVATGVEKRLSRVPCVVKTDRLIIATVSNWGALGLCGAMGQLPSEAELLAAYALCPQAGLIDGITGEPTLSEDGFPIGFVQDLRKDLENWT